MIPFAIVLATLTAGIGSVWLAAALSFGALARYTQHMLSLAAGALLSTAFMHLLPKAFESRVEAHDLFLALLAGLVFFFLLSKAELWHHGHEHHHRPEHSHQAHEHDSADPVSQTSASWVVLAGDSVHCCGDGILIASAFMADMQLGLLAAAAVLVHEVPHHMGDLIVLGQATSNRRMALLKVSLAGAVTALGGLVGYWLVDWLQDYLPYFLVVASGSFIYVALADLIPQLQKQLDLRQTAAQVAWLMSGIALVTVVSLAPHGH